MKDESNCTLSQKTIGEHVAFFFNYSPMPDMRCSFSMLCEVGQRWISTFEGIIAKRGLKLKTIEIDRRPWIITVRA